ncbi:MAG TPA: glycoside hydrolase family 1 protein [Anaerolinea thermolimosa]|uniref:Glycoside hydrolase family 1 protein n=1 Tax=Anaerolinea thermolimosa TaxID=229919 RepID=A0A3D1JF17_9CHLR|nr:glycoside hydrolase family 1 protein [Anaerolinea thermolimosa]GAP05641.1 glycosyl hydrolase family 1 [Anaerolinea thermolimosa]HCE17169.1 glycoside hydrolase family 1 protein [Anaerolinea thermolimosa]
MPQAIFHFPTGFLWGTATSSHQVEGNNRNNDWWAWEEQPGRILNGHRSGLACDWWGGRWREDLDRARETGQNAHRLSIEWSRVQPSADRWDEDALDHYRTILRGMHERGLMPIVNFFHFSLPLWLSEQGGWENDDTPALFARYVRKSVEALREYTSTWMTINEPNVYAYEGYLVGLFPPGKQDLQATMKVLYNLLRGHAMAYREIHNVQREARVGLALAVRPLRPAGPLTFLDSVAARLGSQFFNDAFADALIDGKLNMVFKTFRVPEAAGTQDYVGVNYYTMDLVRFNLLRRKDFFTERFFPPGAELSDTGFIANVPEGMFETIRWARKFKLPILVTENGVEDADDHLRPRYLIEHIHQVWRAVNYNWPVKGYFHWTLVDNFEWERGWTQRFGLWGLDVDTQQRIRRRSVDLYAAICRQNALSSEMVEAFVPALLPRLFPG